jgi:hypothetical protein
VQPHPFCPRESAGPAGTCTCAWQWEGVCAALPLDALPFTAIALRCRGKALGARGAARRQVADARRRQAASRISPVSGPASNLQRRSPSQLNDRSSGGAFETKPAALGPKQKRSTLAQGSATAGRRPSVAAGGGGGYGFISANGTPRTQYSDAATPRGRPAVVAKSLVAKCQCGRGVWLAEVV